MSVVKARGYWIGCDLDGTLAEHYWPHKGKFDPLLIGDPIPSMVAQVKWHLARGEDVRIFTARVGPRREDVLWVNLDFVHSAIHTWTREHLGRELVATNEKDYAMAFLYDDRAIQVEQNRALAHQSNERLRFTDFVVG